MGREMAEREREIQREREGGIWGGGAKTGDRKTNKKYVD